MVLQSDGVDEVEVGVENLLRRGVAEHADEQGHDALHDEGVALGGEVEAPVAVVGMQPHAALAAVNQVLLGLVLLGQGLLVVAQVNEQLVAVHPVVEAGELVYDFVLSVV